VKPEAGDLLWVSALKELNMLSMGNTFHLSLFRIELSDSCTPPRKSKYIKAFQGLGSGG
jgi:hypothetical protein